MGWFSIDNKGNLIGDQPAEGIRYALLDYVQQGAEKPGFDALLRAVEMTLQGHEADYLDPATAAEWPIGTLRHVGRPETSETPSPELLAMVRDLLLGMAQTYEMSVERKPRLAEVLACFIFGLQGDLDDLIADAATLQLRKGDLVEMRASRLDHPDTNKR